MPLKEYSGNALYAQTRRMRKFALEAMDENNCREKLTFMGFVEPIVIEENAELATEAQKEYATDLRLRFPRDITKRDMSYLLDKRLESDSNPNPDLVDYAENRELYPSAYIGKRALYNYIFSHLEGTDRVAFFLFCIYRYTSDDRRGNLDTHPHRDVFYALATELETDSKFMSSMNEYPGEDLRFFGTLRVKGESYYGGSTRKTAYKVALATLQSSYPLTSKENYTLLVEDNQPEDSRAVQAEQLPEAKSKWVALILCVFLGYIGAHKFYEDNTKMGYVYLFTFGLFGLGWIGDIFGILSKPDVYYS